MVRTRSRRFLSVCCLKVYDESLPRVTSWLSNTQHPSAHARWLRRATPPQPRIHPSTSSPSPGPSLCRWQVTRVWTLCMTATPWTHPRHQVNHAPAAHQVAEAVIRAGAALGTPGGGGLRLIGKSEPPSACALRPLSRAKGA